ncbi:Crp/Fnr family transcriptional regulator [Methylorubrum extorquens]
MVQTLKPALQSADPFGRNLLLRSLAAAERRLVASHLEEVRLRTGDVLFESGDDVTHVTFPLDGTVATLLVPLREGRTIETATVGHEGAIGGVVSQGFLPAFNRAVVQIGGAALRVSAARLQTAKQASPVLRNALTRYSDCLLAQVLQSVACNAVHPIEQRSAKWLLTLHDRLGTDTLPVTQELLADMLGVRRTYLSGVLSRLQRQGLIQVSRGRITISNRKALQQAACECHSRVRNHYTEVLGATYRTDGTLVALDPTAAPNTPPSLVTA